MMKESVKRSIDDDCNRLFQMAHPKPTWEWENNVFSSFSTPCKIRIIVNSQVEVVCVDEGDDQTNHLKSGNWESRNILFVPVAMQSNTHKYMEALQKKLSEEKEGIEGVKKEANIRKVEMAHGSSDRSEDEESDSVNCHVSGQKMWAKHLKEHVLTHSSEEKKMITTKKPLTDQKPNSSELTSSASHTKHGFAEASETGKTGYICKTCGACVENIQDHIPVHNDVSKTMCAGCGKSFKSRKYLREHKPICRGQPNCKPCGILFETSKEFKYHMKAGKGACHSRERVQKRIPCEFCELVFYQENRLKRHMLIHTGEKNHCCDLCGKGFARKDYVNRHKKNYPDGACVEKFGKKYTNVSDAKKLMETKLVEVVLTPCM